MVKKAEIEGLFFIHDEHSCIKKASEYGIDVEEGMVVLRREISNTGKSVCRVNGKLVTIATMREIGSSLIDIHGQHEHQELMNDALHVLLLDQYGKKKSFLPGSVTQMFMKNTWKYKIKSKS